MRVGQQHVGKKGKCPACGTVNQIQPDSDLGSTDLLPPSASPPSTSEVSSPYQAPMHTSAGVSNENNSEPDVPGILGVVAGGLSLLGLTLCVCFSPVVIGVLLISIAGLIISCFGRPPLKAIGIGLNLAALVITVLIILVGVVFLFFVIQQQPGGIPMP